MRVTEIYQSNQGEGLLTGTPSVFVRVAGCNLRCQFCDTPFSSWNPEGENHRIDDLVETVSRWQVSHVVITGGEPMIFGEMPEFCREIAARNQHITIETAGTEYVELDCDLMSISPKLSNSTPSRERAGDWVERHERTRNRPEIVQRLMDDYAYQLKFVIDTPADLEEVESYLGQLERVSKDRILFMPQGISGAELDQRAAWLKPYCEERGVVFCDRMHIRWYGNRRGT